MLVVDTVVPGGPADGLLEPGDVLVALEGHVVTHFQPMEALLDGRVGRPVAVEVERGGRLIRTSIQVQRFALWALDNLELILLLKMFLRDQGHLPCPAASIMLQDQEGLSRACK